MKVLFIQPPNESVFMCTPMLGVGYLISFLRDNGFECDYIDAVKTKDSISDIVFSCKEKKPDLIAISIMTMFYNNAKELINKLKILNIPIVIGGAHVSALPVYSFEDLNVDYAIYGEGEYPLLGLMELLKSNNISDENLLKINGLVFRENSGLIRKNSPSELISDLDSLSMPAWDLMDPRTYPFAPHGSVAKRFPIASILSSRGCPFNCDYCAVNVMWRGKYRMRSIKNVVDEIEFLVKKYGVKEIHFEDDNLTVSKSRIIELCDEIVNRKLGIVWACPNGVRIDTLDLEILKKMKASGCYSLSFGIESGSQKILDGVNKRLDLRIVKHIVDLTTRVGIETRAFFILGLPGETLETINETVEFALELNLEVAGFFILTPLPGTKVFSDWLNRTGFSLADLDWDRLNKSSGKDPISVCDLSSDELSLQYKKAFRRFYLRPKIMWKTMLKVKPLQIKHLFKRFLSI